MKKILKLNLQPGSNEIVFSVTTALQGTTKITSNIFLWNYDDKVIVSDIDGTITKSDVGVLNELSNIDENTFQDLFNFEKIYLHNNKFTNKLKLYLEKSLTHITVENPENNDLLNIINTVYLLLI
jgi:hypothetical protein